jgi:WD40 repeat protein
MRRKSQPAFYQPGLFFEATLVVRVLAVAVALGLLPLSGRSATVTDSFDAYTAPSVLAGQNGGSGWAAAWGTPQTNTASLVDTSTTGALSFTPAGATTIGGGTRAVDFSGTGSGYAATRQLLSAQTGTFYVRYLLRWNAGTYSSGNSFYLLLNSAGTSDTANGFNFGYRYNGDVGSACFVRHGTSTPPGGGYATLSAATATNTHCLVAKVEKTSGGNFNSVKVWFDPGATSETDVPNGNIRVSEDLGLASISYVNVRMAANDADDVIRVDELVLGSSWSDVLPVAATAPKITTQPSPVSVYTGVTASFMVVATGGQLAYNWRRWGTNIFDEGNVSGSTSSTLILTNVSLANSADFDVVVTNVNGAITSSVASLTVRAPAEGVASQVLALGPLAFWELNETNDPAIGGVVACDYVGRYNGIYGTNTQNGNANYNIAGPQSSNFPGFSEANTGLKTTWNVTNSYVALPAINYVGRSATMLAWIYPLSYHKESGILFNTRDAVGPVGGGGTNSCGLGFSGVATNAQGQPSLMALWGNKGWDWASGIFVPTNRWSLVAGVVTPTNISVYLFNSSGMQSGSATYTMANCSWTVYGANWLGIDPYDGPSGSFDGSIDDVAFFGYSLSVAQLLQIYQTGASNISSAPIITSPPNPATVNQGSTATFNVVATGGQPMAYRWRRAGTNLFDQGRFNGTTTSNLTISFVARSDVAYYDVVVTNSYSAVTSAAVVLNMVATNLVQISAQPVSLAIESGQSARFTVLATTSGPLSYQWYAAPVGSGVYTALTDGGNISGSTTDTLSISDPDNSDWGSYYVRITNADGAVVNSSVVTLSLATWEQVGHGGGVNAVATSLNGSWIASASDDGTIKLWHAADRSLAHTLGGGTNQVTALDFSADSTSLASGHGDGSIRLWNPATGALVRTINLTWGGSYVNGLGKVASLSFSPDGQLVAAGSGDLYTRIWRVSTGTLLRACYTNAGPVMSVAWSPDGTTLATGSEDKTCRVFNTNSWLAVSGSPQNLGSNVTAVIYSPDGSLLAAGSISGKITLWYANAFSSPICTLTNLIAYDVTNYYVNLNLSTNTYFTNIGTAYPGFTSLAFGTDGRTLFSGDDLGFITRWASSSGSWVPTAHWRAHASGPGGVRSLAISADNSTLVSGGGDCQVSLWRTSDGAALTNLVGHTGSITRVCSSPDGSMVASAGNDGSVRLWAAGLGTPGPVLAIHTNQVSALAFSPDATLLVSGGGFADNTLRIFWCANLALARTIFATVNGVAALAVSPDSSVVASAGGPLERVIRIWSLTDGSLLRTLDGHANGTAVLAFSPNGHYLASGGFADSGTINLWNLNSGSLVRTITPASITERYTAYSTSGYNTSTHTGPLVTNTIVHTCAIQAIAFNPSGSLLASAGDKDGLVNVWQSSSGASVTSLSYAARALAFSPDGALLAAAGSDAIQVWSTANWQSVLNYSTETVGISSLGFSPNGTYLVYGRDDGTIVRIANPLSSRINLVLGVPQTGRLTIANPYSPFMSVWASSDLADPMSWSLLTNVVAATNMVFITDPAPVLPPVRFYQVTTPP